MKEQKDNRIVDFDFDALFQTMAPKGGSDVCPRVSFPE